MRGLLPKAAGAMGAGVRFGPWFWLWVLVVGTGAGALYGILFQSVSPAISALFGACTGTLLFGFERRLLFPALQARLARLPTPLYLVGSLAAYVTLIVLGNALAGGVLWATGILGGSFAEAVVPTARVVLYSLMVSAMIVFVLRMRDLIGGETFLNLLLGRYHKPVREDRIFLFIDLVGSTAHAYRLSDMQFQELLGRFLATHGEPVRRCRGSIDDYIGDMAMVTWPLTRGIEDARCLHAIRGFQEEIDRHAAEWEAQFGARPRFRAVLHCGPVVTADVGVEKHKIAYFGDTVNTTARLEALCRDLGRDVLISSDLLSRLTVPPGFAFDDLGARALRGRDQLLDVFALRTGRAP